MERYEKYKDSGVEWIGEIPVGWSVKKLKYGVSVNPSKYDTDKESDELVVFLAMEKVSEDGKIDCSIKKPISELYKGFTFFKKNDVIVAKITPCFENGKGALLNELETDIGFGSTEFHVLRAKQDISNRFLYYLTKSEIFMKVGEAFMSGAAGQKRVPTDFIANFPLASPSLGEQIYIANYLDCKTAEIDALIVQKERLITLYEEEKCAIINQAVTKGTDPNAKLKDSGIDWLGEIPKSWGVSRLKNICSVRQGLQIPISERVLIQTDDCLPYITIKSINNPSDAKEFIENPSKNVVCSKDDILVARTGATGEIITDVEGVFHNNFFLVDYDRKQVIKRYLINFLKSPRIKEYLLLVAGTTTIPDLNHDAFYCTPFFVLTHAEQNAIVQHIEVETTRINAKIAKTRHIIELQKEYRTALISEVVAGKIKVPHLVDKEIAQ